MSNIIGFRHYIDDSGKVIGVVHKYNDDTIKELSLADSCKELKITQKTVKDKIITPYMELKDSSGK